MSSGTAGSVEEAILRRRHRITTDEFHIMAESGALGDEPRRFELIEGVIVERMAEGPEHMTSCDLVEHLLHLLHRLVPAGYFASMGHPVTIAAADTEPIPDAMILRGAIRDFASRRRTPADAAAIFEVSNTSLEDDQTIKAAIYAAAGVPYYYLVNIPERLVEVRSGIVTPRGGGPPRYGRLRRASPRSKVRLVLDGVAVGDFRAREVLP